MYLCINNPFLCCLLPISSSPIQHSPGSLCFPHDPNDQIGSKSGGNEGTSSAALHQSYRGIPTELGVLTGMGQNARFKNKKGTSAPGKAFPHSLKTLRVEWKGSTIWTTCSLHLCMPEGLPGAETAERRPSFLPALLDPMTTPICDWLAGSKTCGKSLRYQVFPPVIWGHSVREENWINAYILSW